mmetsp:Transcript_8578/g.14477  ORF Transcript_8578/g.14477 Transcript_8578/m.14477 type:complete len:90 (-) Transcript_8578:581-850(-)
MNSCELAFSRPRMLLAAPATPLLEDLLAHGPHRQAPSFVARSPSLSSPHLLLPLPTRALGLLWEDACLFASEGPFLLLVLVQGELEVLL